MKIFESKSSPRCISSSNMTTLHLNMKTTMILPTLPALAPRRTQTRYPSRPRPLPHATKFDAEDAIFAVTLLVFVVSVVACFFWMWK